MAQLVLNTLGLALRTENGEFIVMSDSSKKAIHPSGINSILIFKGVSITSDAIMLAVDNEIEIIFTDRNGNPKGRVWSPKFGSVSSIRKGQINFTFSKDAVFWIKDVICNKIDNQQAMLLMLMTDDDERLHRITERSMVRLNDYREKITKLDGDIVRDIAASLRGWEGQASRIYFETMNEFLPEQYRFEKRSQAPALDVSNAMLNYGYGMLYGKIEGAMIKAGIDPYVGILHRDDYNRPVLVFDVIELYRVWIDYVVYRLLMQEIITDDFYSVKEDGSVWLETLGRRVLIQSVNDYFNEITTINGISRSREMQMFLQIQSLAQKFKNYCV